MTLIGWEALGFVGFFSELFSVLTAGLQICVKTFLSSDCS